MSNFFVVLLCLIVIAVLWVFFKNLSEGSSAKDAAGNAWGCLIFIFFALVFVFMCIGSLKSCADQASDSPSYDYYDDHAR